MVSMSIEEMRDKRIFKLKILRACLIKLIPSNARINSIMAKILELSNVNVNRRQRIANNIYRELERKKIDDSRDNLVMTYIDNTSDVLKYLDDNKDEWEILRANIIVNPVHTFKEVMQDYLKLTQDMEIKKNLKKYTKNVLNNIIEKQIKKGDISVSKDLEIAIQTNYPDCFSEEYEYGKYAYSQISDMILLNYMQICKCPSFDDIERLAYFICNKLAEIIHYEFKMDEPNKGRELLIGAQYHEALNIYQKSLKAYQKFESELNEREYEHLRKKNQLYENLISYDEILEEYNINAYNYVTYFDSLSDLNPENLYRLLKYVGDPEVISIYNKLLEKYPESTGQIKDIFVSLFLYRTTKAGNIENIGKIRSRVIKEIYEKLNIPTPTINKVNKSRGWKYKLNYEKNKTRKLGA